MGFLSSLFSGLKSAVGGVGGLLGKAASGIGNLFGGSGSQSKNLLSSFSKAPSLGPITYGSGAGGVLKNPIPNLSGFSSQKPTTGLMNGFGSLIKKNPMQSLGIGSILMSQLFPNPKVPEMPESFRSFSNMAQSGGTGIGQLGTEKLNELLSSPMQAATEDELSAATRDLEYAKQQEIDQVRDLYRNLRPGSDPSSDSSFRRDIQEVTERYDRAITDTRASLRRNVNQANTQNRLSQIMASGQLDQNTMSQLAQVANWDIARIMTEFNMDADDASALKDMLMQEGVSLFNQGMGFQQNNLLDALFSR
jgi:hypothetical protein